MDKADYDAIDEMDELEVVNVPGLYEQPIIEVKDLTKNKSFKATTQLTKEDLDILMDGGALNYIRNHQ